MIKAQAEVLKAQRVAKAKELKPQFYAILKELEAKTNSFPKDSPQFTAALKDLRAHYKIWNNCKKDKIKTV